MIFLIKRFNKLFFLCILLFSCSTKQESRKISFWIPDEKTNSLVNENSDYMNFSDERIKFIACLNKDDLMYLYSKLGGSSDRCMDSNATLDANRKPK